MSRNFVSSKVCALLACSSLLVASIGCSPGTPTAPSLAPQNVVESPDFVRILSASGKNTDGPVLSESFTAKLISAANGGTISNGRVTLTFPPKALNEDTEITIMMATDGTLGVELGPHGINFNVPVIMTTDLRGTTAENQAATTSTIWYNPDNDWWELIEQLETNDPNSASAYLEHFSKFAQGVVG